MIYRFRLAATNVFIICMGSFSQLPTNGLIAHYSLDNVGTTIIDSSDNGNDGTAVDVLPAKDRFDHENAAGNFNGVTSKITVEDAPALRPTILSISAWVKLNSLGYDRKIVGKNLNDTISDSYNLGIYKDNKIEFWIYNDDWYGVRGSSGGTVVATGVWYHVVGVYDGNTITTYLNTSVDRKNNVGNIPIQYSTSPLFIGKTPTANFLDGFIDDIRIYNRALSTAEIQTLYTNGHDKATILIPYSPDPTQERKPTLAWFRVDDTCSYTIQVCTSPDFTNPFISDATADTFYTALANFPFGTIYWHVKSSLSTQYSNPDTFTILNDSIPFLIPMTPDTQYTRKPYFKWRQATGSTQYRLQIDTTKYFTNPYLSIPVTDTFYTPETDLPLGRLFWRVGTMTNPPRFSNVDSFMIVLQGAIAPEKFPAGAKVSTVSITVHSHGVSVDYACTKVSDVSFDLFTLSGNRIVTVFAANKPAGRYTLSWNGSNRQGQFLSAGSYLCVFRVGRQTFTKKLSMVW